MSSSPASAPPAAPHFDPDSAHEHHVEAKRWSRAAEEKLRRMFLHDVREKCKDKVSAYAKCAKEEGFMVVFRCREHQTAANECVKQFSSDAQYADYKREKTALWVKQGLLVPEPSWNLPKD